MKDLLNFSTTNKRQKYRSAVPTPSEKKALTIKLKSPLLIAYSPLIYSSVNYDVTLNSSAEKNAELSIRQRAYCAHPFTDLLIEDIYRMYFVNREGVRCTYNESAIRRKVINYTARLAGYLSVIVCYWKLSMRNLRL